MRSPRSRLAVAGRPRPACRLRALGTRICIIGPSGSGKSTLADAIGTALDLPVVHLDRLRHVPGTRWELRSDDEFERLHASAVAGDRWVLDGNYSALLPARLERATGLVALDVSLVVTLFRYVQRTLRRGDRVGGIDVRERLSWRFVRYNIRFGSANRRRRRAVFEASRLPKVQLVGVWRTTAFIRAEGLRLRR